ncbi:MAG: hypothetical protein WAU75_12675 [Solirubrobacteraceae bacterium]
MAASSELEPSCKRPFMGAVVDRADRSEDITVEGIITDRADRFLISWTEDDSTGRRIVVGIGSNRVQRAQVTIVRGSRGIEIRLSPGGLIADLVLNTLVIARRVHRVLVNAPGFRAPS